MKRISLLLALLAASASAQDCQVTVPTGDGHANQGSGVLVKPDLVITNWHVVESLTACTVKFPCGTVKGTVECRDALHDLAAIRLEYAPDVPVAEFGDTPEVGTEVIAHGYGAGKFTERTGKVIEYPNYAAVGRAWFHCSAPVRSGDSGGGAYDQRGRLIGIRRAGTGQQTNEEGRTLHHTSIAVHCGIVRAFLTERDWKWRTK